MDRAMAEPLAAGEEILIPLSDLREVSALSGGVEPRLAGSKCIQCAALMIGERIACSTCMSTEVVAVDLSASGRVYSWTRLHVMPGREGPVDFGYVDLNDGVRVLTELRLGRDLVIDEPVTLAVGAAGEWFFVEAEAGEQVA